MPCTDTASNKARFLVHSAGGAALNDFLTLAASDPEISVVDTIGPRERPHTAVVEISTDKARVLDQHFRRTSTPTHRLTIEPDRPLSMFDGGPSGPY
jgi:hypothetical protein